MPEKDRFDRQAFMSNCRFGRKYLLLNKTAIITYNSVIQHIK